MFVQQEKLGLWVECRGGSIHVLSGSPESMICCMAHMADGSTIVSGPQDRRREQAAAARYPRMRGNC